MPLDDDVFSFLAFRVLECETRMCTGLCTVILFVVIVMWLLRKDVLFICCYYFLDLGMGSTRDSRPRETEREHFVWVCGERPS